MESIVKRIIVSHPWKIDDFVRKKKGGGYFCIVLKNRICILSIVLDNKRAKEENSETKTDELPLVPFKKEKRESRSKGFADRAEEPRFSRLIFTRRSLGGGEGKFDTKNLIKSRNEMEKFKLRAAKIIVQISWLERRHILERGREEGRSKKGEREREVERDPRSALSFFSLTIPQLKSISIDNDCRRIGCGEFLFPFPFFSFQMLPLVISSRGKASVKFDEDRIEQ